MEMEKVGNALKYMNRALNTLILLLTANIPILTARFLNPWWLLIILPGFAEVNFWFFDLLTVILVESVQFWNGILQVYCTSSQIGIKWKVMALSAAGSLPQICWSW